MDNIWGDTDRRMNKWASPTFSAGEATGSLLSSFLTPDRSSPFGGPAFSQDSAPPASPFGGNPFGGSSASIFNAHQYVSPFASRSTGPSGTQRAMDFASQMASVWGQVGSGAAGAAKSAADAAIGLAGGNVGSVGPSDNPQLDQANPDINASSAKWGVPAGLLKTIINNESSGDWAGNGNRYVTSVRPASGGILPYVGIFENAWQSWGCPGTGAGAVGNQAAQIDCLAQGLRGFYDQNPQAGWDGVITMHFAGETAPTGWSDENGMTDYQYLQNAKANWAKYDASGAASSSGVGAGIGSSLGGLLGGAGTPPVNTAVANRVLDVAKTYVGVPYVWGAIPGKGQDPRQTGWDCSGFTYWLDQNYGTGQLPMGSHYQYQDAQQRGTLFTDPNQMVPGDLMFFDTGPDNGGGAELNRAGHVAIYLGNGQIIEAANPSDGTIIADFQGYYSQRFIGAEHMSWSGGAAGTVGATAAAFPQTSAGMGVMQNPYANWTSRTETFNGNPYANWGRSF